MKLIIALLSVCLFSLNSQAKDDTSAVVTARLYADCMKYDYPYVSTVYDIKKASETTSHVSFTFRTFVASCTSKMLKVLTVDPKFVWVSVSGDGEEVDYKVTPTETFVTLTFDKDDAFEDDRTSRTYSMGYYPWGAFQAYFPWKVVISKNAAGSAALKIN